MSIGFLETAIVRLRRSLSQPNGSSTDGWRLLYAAHALAEGKRCLDYEGRDAMGRLVADIKDYLPEMRGAA